jgi:hypothetical protein
MSRRGHSTSCPRVPGVLHRVTGTDESGPIQNGSIRTRGLKLSLTGVRSNGS